MKTCDTCGSSQPYSKFATDSFSPNTCFKCRIGSVNLGFGGNKEAFHGDTLVGGTIKSDNDFTVKTARGNGLNPVPVKNGESAWVPSASQAAKLKKALGG